MKTELEFISAGSEVLRYHTLHTLQRETVGHHSHGVAMLCTLLAPQCSAALLRAALVHDLAEHRTGDIPAPAKRFFDIHNQVNMLEEALLSTAGLGFPLLTAVEHRTLKLADTAQGALFCAREVQLGNSRMRSVMERYFEYADEFNPQGSERELFNLIKEMVQ